MDYLIAFGDGVNPNRPQNGSGINVRFLFCLIYKKQLCTRTLLVHWVYQKCSYREFLQCIFKKCTI